ncbi:MAG: ABC transporter transmembrane domain-containing protein, partial [Pseudomonadota bacterium]
MTPSRHDRLYRMPHPAPAIFVASLALSVLGLAMPVVMLQVFDRIIPNGSTETLTVLMAALTLVIGLELILRHLRATLLLAQAQGEAGRLGARALAGLLHAAEPEAETSAAQIHRQLQSADGLRDRMASPARLHAIELPFALIALGAIWAIGGPLVAVTLIALGFLAILAFAIRGIQREVLAARSDTDQARYDLLADALSRIATIKTGRLEPALRRDYGRLQAASARAGLSATLSSGMFGATAAIAGQALSSAMVLAGAWFVIAGRIGPAELAACTMLGSRAAQPALASIRAWAAGETNASVLRDLKDGLSRMPAPDAPPSEPFEADISFDDVTKRISRSGRAILRSDTFEITHGARADLVCQASASAAMLADLLLGETQPDRGRIKLAGRDPESWAGRRGPGGIVVVDDQALTLDGSIIDNIAPDGDELSHARAYEAAERVGLDVFVNTLPMGWETALRGTGLHLGSTGVLQQIALARAIA